MKSMLTKTIIPSQQNVFFKFNQFTLKDQNIVQSFIDRFQPFSCEYNFSDLFTWQYASQMINSETAKFFKNKCRYLNREQDLGIKGLRQAKISYEPLQLITPYTLIFTLA